MPRFDKSCVSQYTATGCEKQLYFELHPDTTAYRGIRQQLDIPDRQVRVELAQIRQAGETWGEAKINDLNTAFGRDRLHGGTPSDTGTPAQRGLRFPARELRGSLAGVHPGDFLIECEFDVDTAPLIASFQLGPVIEQYGLEFARVRPDVIEVLPHRSATHLLMASGQVITCKDTDERHQLRVIDVKLSSEPGPGYFAEIAYYSVTLACWLEAEGLAERYAVAANAAIWPGNYQVSGLQRAVADGASSDDRYEALHEDLVTAPIGVFIAKIRSLLQDVVPRVLATHSWTDLPWHVNAKCRGCDYLGQRFPGEREDPDDPPDPRRCIPTAEATGHLSRIPFISRGAVSVLRQRQVPDVASLATLEPESRTFDEHHSLRAQRGVVAARARVLDGGEAEGRVPQDGGTSAIIPRYSDLRLYLTADFDPTSAITLAFGLRGFWSASQFGPGAGNSQAIPSRVFFVEHKTLDDEWGQLVLLLAEIDLAVTRAQQADPDASMQVFIWDQLTYDHLTRVVGRHLGRIIGDNQLRRLAWLFPPDQLAEAPQLVAASPVSLVREAIRSLAILPVAHTYSLMSTARCYHSPGIDDPERFFRLPNLWEDPFSDQIPPERAHQLWNRRPHAGGMTHAQLVGLLTRAVETKLRGLEIVTRRLGEDLGARLRRRSPKIRALTPPSYTSGVSDFGQLLVIHAKLNAALSKMDIAKIRATPASEREARFQSARLVRRLQGQETIDALGELGLGGAVDRWVYQLAPGSGEVRAEVGEFQWALCPEDAPDLLEQTVGSVAGQARVPPDTRHIEMSRILEVTISAIDRDRGLIALDGSQWASIGQVRSTLVDAGVIDLDGQCTLDPVYRDFFTKPLTETLRAIGNPPSAVRDQEIRAATGITSAARRTVAIPVEDILWGDRLFAETVVVRDTGSLKQSLDERGESLNESQLAAWDYALTHRISLIWGPPGTGKSRTLRSIIGSLIQESAMSTTPFAILVTANTYVAVDTVIQPLVVAGGEQWPGVRFRRLRSIGQLPPDWLPADVDVDAGDPGQLGQAATDLGTSGVTVVGATPQQVRKLINQVVGSPAGPVFNVIVIDEASQMDVGHAVLAVAGIADEGQLVVAGDPKQLPPIHAASPPDGLGAFVGPIYEFFSEARQIQPRELNINYRSNHQLVAFAREAGYPRSLRSWSPNMRIQYRIDPSLKPTDWPSTLHWDPYLGELLDPERPVVCIVYSEGISGQWNQFEVDTVSALVWLLERCLSHSLRQEYAPSGELLPEEPTAFPEHEFWQHGIGVVTPHRAQRARIVGRLQSLFPAVPRSVIRSAVDTVERFQGQERGVVLASYAVGDPDLVSDEAEFLQNLNRFNVMATRARAKLIVMATEELIQHVASDLEVIRSSELMKRFAETFCNEREPRDLGWIDADSQKRIQAVSVRWRRE